jgi:nicotinamidase-related amidase
MEVCVLSTMPGAINQGSRVILATNACCSTTDEAQHAIMNIYMNRFCEQIKTVSTKLLPDSWSRTSGLLASS